MPSSSHPVERFSFSTALFGMLVLTIVVDGKEIKVKAQDVQRHPYKPKLQHIDFVRA